VSLLVALVSFSAFYGVFKRHERIAEITALVLTLLWLIASVVTTLKFGMVMIGSIGLINCAVFVGMLNASSRRHEASVALPL
jgi:predicted membrane-bound spermidine synthase